MKNHAISIAGAIALFFSFGILLPSCGGGSDTSGSSSTEAKEPPKSMIAEEPEPIEVSADGSTVTIHLTGDDMMKYNLNRIEVKEGQKIKLTLTHVGKMPKEAMGHNFVLLQPGVEPASFAAEAARFKDNDYIPESGEGFIVHTKMVGGGESTSIEFDAPAKGSYKFMCSFPAHYVNMQGDFIVN
ncbi:MAG: azurin [Lewinellaceae bacterium]|nr:azurin [Lewinellaceae bacterium]